MQSRYIFIGVAIVAFALSRIAKRKAKSVLVAQDLKISEERIKELELHVGQQVTLQAIPHTRDVAVSLNGDRLSEEGLGTFTQTLYDEIARNNVRAYIYAINGDIVSLDLRMGDS